MSKSPWLELFETGDRGLGLRVTRDCPAGAALLTEKPLAAALGAGEGRCRRRRCRRCLSLLSLRKPSLLRACRCSDEGDPCYCDSDCEEEDRDAHVLSGECELLRRARGGGERDGENEATTTPPPPFLREACLALRLLRARPPSAGPLVTHDDELLSSSSSGLQLGAATELASRALEATMARAREERERENSDSSAPAPLPPPVPFETISGAVSAALCAAVVNSVELDFCDEDKEGGGGESGDDDDDGGSGDDGETRSGASPLAVYAFACRANHSCRPTASSSTRSKGKVSLRALGAMEKGEEVTINYLCSGRKERRRFSPLAERRELLERVHRFRCECGRCLLDEREEGEEEKRESGGDEEMEEEEGDEDGAVLRSLAHCLEAERLLSRGETAAIEIGGRAWAEAAEKLVQAAGEALTTVEQQQTTTTAAAFASSSASPSAPSFAGPPAPPGLFPAVFSAAEACAGKNQRALASLSRAFSGARDAPSSSATAEEERAKASLRQVLGADSAAPHVFSLTVAAAHASARSASLLGAALGTAHALAERARFAAFGGRRRRRVSGDEQTASSALPFDVAAQVVRLASCLERAM